MGRLSYGSASSTLLYFFIFAINWSQFWSFVNSYVSGYLYDCQAYLGPYFFFQGLLLVGIYNLLVERKFLIMGFYYEFQMHHAKKHMSSLKPWLFIFSFIYCWFFEDIIFIEWMTFVFLASIWWIQIYQNHQ